MSFSRHDTESSQRPLSAVDYHLLLVLAEADSYGYAMLKAMREESGGALRLDIGSLYRAIARLEGAGLVAPARSPLAAAPAPGRPRRYYRLTARGREALQREAERLRGAVALAEERLSVESPR